MKELLKLNITNYLNWDDKNAGIDETFTYHELLALMVYNLNYNHLDVYNWYWLTEYDEGELLEQIQNDLGSLFNKFMNDVATVEDFKFINENLINRLQCLFDKIVQNNYKKCLTLILTIWYYLRVAKKQIHRKEVVKNESRKI